MTKEESKQARTVMEAWENNADIEWKMSGLNSNWRPVCVGDNIDWNWAAYTFRIKPEPMEIEVWVHPNSDVKCAKCTSSPCSADEKMIAAGWVLKPFREIL